MRRRRAGCLPLAAAAVILALVASHYFRLRGVTADMRSDFEWFQKLGFPDVKACPYVRVATGRWSQTGDDASRSKQYENAFLLATNGNALRILSADLSVETLTNSPPNAPEYERVGFEVLDFRQVVLAEIQRLGKPPNKEDVFRLFGTKATEQTETFALAWACWRRGLDSEARRLYDAASTMPRQYRYKPARKLTLRKIFPVAWEWVQEKWRELTAKNSNAGSKLTLRQSVQKDLTTAAIWRATLAFGDKSITRPQLLAQLKAFLSHFPGSEYEDKAKRTVNTLDQMIVEDETHVAVEPAQLLRLPVDDRVRELIFELRDQNGEQVSQPGACDIFIDVQGSTNTPAHQLVRIGYAAVPQLIEALDTETLTRSVNYWRDFTYSHEVLTVGYCAHVILKQITGMSLDPGNAPTNGPPGAPSAMRKTAQAWWNEFQRKGERQMLIESVSTGGDDAPDTANLLCQNYPDAAPQALSRGIQACNSDWVRVQLVKSLASLRGSEAIPLLQHELTNSPYLETRVQAAFGLFVRAKEEALSAMIAEWQNLRKLGNGSDDGEQRLIAFLGACDSPEAVSALSNGLASRSVETRFEVVEQIGEGRQYDAGSQRQSFSTATMAAEEALLVSELNDTEERTGMSGSRDGVSYTNPRICDMAAWYLSERWPSRYRFDIRKSMRNREVQRISCLNAWRSTHSLPLKPLPDTNLPKVSRQHSTWVMRVEYATNGVTPQPAFTARVNRLKGRTLRDDDMIRLLCDFAKKPEPGAAGVQILAERDDDLTGVRITIRLVSPLASNASQDWEVNQRVTLKNESILGSSGMGGGETYQEPEGWDDLAEAIKRVTSAPAETPFTVSISLKQQK